MNQKYRIGILTYHRACNYGAFLQACALCMRLNQEPDINAEIIDFRMQKEVQRYDKYSAKRLIEKIADGSLLYDRKILSAFRADYTNPLMKVSQDSLVSDSCDDFRLFVSEKYDIIIVGSDEIWKVNNFRGFPNPYWLIGDYNCRKFSYAASARVEFKKCLGDAEYSVLSNAINSFEFIGVRDTQTQNEITKLTNKIVHLCCDPSFLVDFPIQPYNLSQLNHYSNFDPHKPSIMIMIDQKELSYDIVKQLNKDYNLIAVYKKIKGCINLPDLGPLSWLSLIKAVDFVIASYFHAICFSIVTNTAFIAIGTKGKSGKLTELLETKQLQSHYVESQKSTDFRQLVLSLDRTPDYSEFILKKRESFMALLNAIRTKEEV